MGEDVPPVVAEDEILIGQLNIVQSLDAQGDLHVYDLSRSSDGGELEPSKALELIEFARASILAPMVLSMIEAQECTCDEDDD